MTEIGWLIEKADNESSTPLYVCIPGRMGRCNYPFEKMSIEWTKDHMMALRFSRETDATKFVYMMIQLSGSLPVNETLPGLRAGDNIPHVREHLWYVRDMEGEKNVGP